MAGNLVALVLSALLLALRWAPKRLFAPAGAWLAWVIRPFARKDVAHLRRNVAEVFGLPPASHFAVMFERQVFRHHMTCALETLRIIQQPSAMQLEGLSDLRDAVAEAERHQKGHEIITAHLGSWELCARLGQSVATRPFQVLAKPPKNAAVRRFLTGVRERMGVKVLWTDRKSILKDMLTGLRQGGSIGFVMDQKPEGRQGPLVPFFGRPTEFVSGPAAMAARTGCAVIGVFCVREAPFRYRVVTRPILAAGHGETDEIAMTAKMAAAIEDVIRLYPEQWTWNYKRWRVATVSP